MRRLATKLIAFALTVVLTSPSRYVCADDPAAETQSTKAATASTIFDSVAAKPFLGEWRIGDEGQQSTLLVLSQGPKGDVTIEMPAEPGLECEITNIKIQGSEMTFVENYSVKKASKSRRLSALNIASDSDGTQVVSKLMLPAGDSRKLQYSCVAKGMTKPSENSLTRGGPDFDDGSPYGRFGEDDFDAFNRFAAANGVDVQGDAKKRLDVNSEALQQFFALSLKFDRLDMRARVYAHIVYCLQLNAYTRAIYDREEGLRKLKDLVAAIKSQPPEVKQRIIDIINCGPAFRSEVARKEFEEKISRLTDEESDPTWLLLIDHEYGANDPVFAPWPDRVFKDESNDQESID